ncbi:MAG: (2Fe-2S) ferredoxin domain-containing protein, partial [Candidatus Accumulibacter sp.]|nr:(2Fe-2S) ferredoxin domain-containing protein [Accumulibacter sp.]
MGYYKRHVFFCGQKRPDGEVCCANGGAAEAQGYAKDRIGELKLKGPGGVRINKAGCLGRCEEGPVVVVYPEGVWYRYANTADIEEIVQ